MEDKDEESALNEFFIRDYNDAGSYTRDALLAILNASKSSNNLPSSGDDYDYYSAFPMFRAAMHQQKERILNLMTAIAQSYGVHERFQEGDVDKQYDLLIDTNDVIFENASNCMDEAPGLKKPEDELVISIKPNTIQTSWNKKQFSASNKSLKLLTAKNISRPQLTFKDPVDNKNCPFVPILKEKPNSITPLAITLEKDGDREEFCHPYEWEIENFDPVDEILQEVEPVVPKPLEDTPLHYVRTTEQLQAMFSDLRSQKEFAVDLEHHSYRSFQGFTCLMQISTRTTDYIVDTLELRSDLHVLNEVFTDPKIVKVLHGANSDVLWLQRDFGIYIVNLFDTGQAARVLHFAHLSLSYLLKHYCKLEVDKQFQLADWRMRPLPIPMVKYAREDTHYLLYVYDCLKNDLLKTANGQTNLLCSVFNLSKIICAKKYEKPLFHDDKYLELYKKSKKLLNAKQLYCLKELYSWRDRIARENDESFAYVLPDHMMLQIAETLPREQQGILACCNPIPPLVKQQLNELHTIIVKANESSLKQLETLELQHRAQTAKMNIYTLDLNSLIHCPHDVHHLEDKKGHNVSGGADNMISMRKSLSTSPSLLKDSSILSFRSSTQAKEPSKQAGKVTELMKKLISPFERFKVTENLQTKEKEVIPKKNKALSTEMQVEDTDEVEIIPNDITVNQEETQVIDVDADTVIPKQKKKSNETEPTPIRTKSNKKRNKRKSEPDISLTVTPAQCPPAKKICTPENEKPFQPYKYDQSEFSNNFGKKHSKEDNRNRNQHAKQGQKGYFGKKKKHVKQAIYGGESSSGTSNNSHRAWPKNK